MLTRELMGALALGILWVNVLLIAYDALRRAKVIGELARTLGRARSDRGLDLSAGGGPRDVLVSGTVSSAGPVGLCEIEQTGRVGSSDTDTRRSILFHDRRYGARAPGGELEVEGRPIDVPATSAVDVWVEGRELAALAALPSSAALEAAYPDAKKGRGFHRTVTAPLERGRRVWAFGSLELRGERATLGPASATGALLLSTFEPFAFTRAARAKLFGFAVALVASAALVTALTLVPPAFGAISTVGAALGLALFLLAQPAGVGLKEVVRYPGKQPVRGVWRVTSSGGATATAEREGA